MSSPIFFNSEPSSDGFWLNPSSPGAPFVPPRSPGFEADIGASFFGGYFDDSLNLNPTPTPSTDVQVSVLNQIPQQSTDVQESVRIPPPAVMATSFFSILGSYERDFDEEYYVPSHSLIQGYLAPPSSPVPSVEDPLDSFLNSVEVLAVDAQVVDAQVVEVPVEEQVISLTFDDFFPGLKDFDDSHILPLTEEYAELFSLSRFFGENDDSEEDEFSEFFEEPSSKRRRIGN